MDEKILDQELKLFDFSQCHPIKEKLLAELLTLHRRDNAPKGKWRGLMSDDELELASAAGNPALQKPDDERKY